MEQCGNKWTSFCETSLGRLTVLRQTVKTWQGYPVNSVLVIYSRHIILLWLETICVSVSDSILTVHPILVKSPHLQWVIDDVFGNEGVVESFWCHMQLIIKYARKTGFYLNLYHKRFFSYWFYLSYASCGFTRVICLFGSHFWILFYLIYF